MEKAGFSEDGHSHDHEEGEHSDPAEFQDPHEREPSETSRGASTTALWRHRTSFPSAWLVASCHIRYRSPEPVLSPELPKEREGIVLNVVIPTAIELRDDLGMPDRFDVYYGMADNRIGVARLDSPALLPDQDKPQHFTSPGGKWLQELLGNC